MENIPLPKEEWDFSFLSSHEDQKRSAVLYEYARENIKLKEWIIELRGCDAYGAGFTLLSEDQKRYVGSRLAEEHSFLHIMETKFLAVTTQFPEQSFWRALPHIDPSFHYYINGGSISKPRGGIYEIPINSWDRARITVENSAPFVNGEHSAYVFVVPWKNTSNEDLTAQFRLWLEHNRPNLFPERKRIGRNSGHSDGANHKLNQLGAYRFYKAGLTREQAHHTGFEFYARSSDWDRAVEEATVRIKQLYP